jgi:hypothetical protein
MNRFIVLIVSISVATAFAAVPESTVLQAAEAFRSQQFSSYITGLKSVTPYYSDTTLAGYIAEYEPEGFVFFRADTNAAPVKLYSEQGTFSNLPPDFISVISTELTEELTAIKLHKRENMLSAVSQHILWDSLLADSRIESSAQKSAAATSGGPLLSSLWNQDSQYNTLCPDAYDGPGGRAYAGCVATAMAQVMKYHNYPPQGNSSEIYQDKWGNCLAWHTGDFGATSYDWSNMPYRVTSSTDAASKTAVNLITYHAGISVSMDYEATGSGAQSSDVPDALRDYFKYDCLDLSGRQGGSSYEPWYTRIKTEIDKNRPTYYSFIDDSIQIGHAVVCDGYQNGSDIHLNMGWGGTGNAWYNLNNISYGSYTFNTRHQAVFGICPEGELDDKYEPNDAREAAQDISPYLSQWLGETKDGIGIQANEDWYKFTIADAPATVMITCAFQNVEGNLELFLYQDTTKVAESRTTNDGEAISWIAQSPGTYYIHVDSYNTPGYPYVKVYWLNEYDLMYTVPEGGMLAGIMCVMLLWQRKYLKTRR